MKEDIMLGLGLEKRCFQDAQPRVKVTVGLVGVCIHEDICVL